MMNAIYGSLTVAVLTISVQFTMARRGVLLEFSKERQNAYTSYLEASLMGIRHVKLAREIHKARIAGTIVDDKHYEVVHSKMIEQSFVYESQLSNSLARVHIVAPLKYRDETYAMNNAITNFESQNISNATLDAHYAKLAELFHNDIQGIFSRATKIRSFFSIKFLLNGK